MGQQVKDLAVTAAAQVAVMARVPSLAREHVVGMVKKKMNAFLFVLMLSLKLVI